MSKVANKLVDKWWFWVGAVVVTGGAAYVVAKQGKKLYDKIQDDRTNSNIDKGNSSKAFAPIEAQKAYAAMFRTGSTWLPDGTDEDALFLVADSIRSGRVLWSDLVAAYKTQFDRNLVTDLTDELDAEDLATFWSRAGKQFQGLGNSNKSIISLI